MPSSVRPTRDSSLRIRIAPEEVTLRDWPLVDRPVGSLAAIGLAAGLSWLAGWAADSALLGCGLGAVLALTLWKTWLPARYELGGSGITQSVLGWRRRIPWLAIRRYEVRPRGVLLLPDAAVTPLSPLRGLYLHCGAQLSPVLAHLEYYVPSWEAQGASRRSAGRIR
jgi:hypothetical protein